MQRLFLTLLMVAMAGIATAQYIVPDTALTAKNAIYHRLGISYNSLNFNDEDHPVLHPLSDIGTVPGMSLGYTIGLPVFRNRPVFFESGLEANIFFASKDKSGVDMEFKWISFSVPLNLKYYFRIPGTKLHISPFVGLSLNFNAYGRLKSSAINDGGSVDLIFSNNGLIRTIERFTYDAHAGVGVDYNRCHFRFMYGYCESYNPYVLSDCLQFGFFYDI